MDFMTGFSRVDITPPVHGVPLGGYGTDLNRLSENTLDPLTFTAIAFCDEDNEKALVCTVDLLRFSEPCAARAHKMIAEKFGIKRENVLICATHTHCGPSVYTSDEKSVIWKEYFFSQIEKAVKNALDDLAESEIFTGRIKYEHENYVRRYKSDKGTWLSITDGGKRVEHETDPDNVLQGIKFARKGKKDIVMINWGAHPCFNCGAYRPDISADYPGNLRLSVEEKLNCHCAFYEAAAGNLVTTGHLSGEQPYKTAEDYAEAMTRKIVENIDSFVKVAPGKIKGLRREIDIPIDHSFDSQCDKAREVQNLRMQKEEEKAKALATEYGFPSVYFCAHILTRKSSPASESLCVWALSIGNIAFCGVPYEMFDTNGMQVKKNSPYDLTFICEQTNGANAYIPSKIACEHGGYEVTACKFVPGTGENLANELISMLNELKK